MTASSYMMAQSYSATKSDENKFGIIILGNSGVGKSFITNIILNKEISKNDYSNQSVTRQSEFQEITFGDNHYAIYDTPGLIEADQRRIDINKREIDKAFTERPTSIVIYIFEVHNNCIRDEDFIAFKVLNEAYSFDLNSLLLIVNNLSAKRPENFEGEIMVTIQNISQVSVSANKICFLNHVDIKISEELKALKSQVLRGIVELSPTFHSRACSIELRVDDIADLKKNLAKVIEKFAQNKTYSEYEIQRQQEAYNNFRDNQKLDFELSHENIDLKAAGSNEKYELEKKIQELKKYSSEFVPMAKQATNYVIGDLVHILMDMNNAGDKCQLGDIILPNLKQIQFDHVVEFYTSQGSTYSSKPSLSEEKYRTFDSNQNIQIHCLHVALDDKKLFPKYETKIFQDDFIFVNNTLKIEDRRLFLIIATKVAAYVIPLIQKHFCVENIYLFSSTGDEVLENCSEISEKINDISFDLEKLCEKVNRDITTMSSKPFYEHRSCDVFTMLHTQTFIIDQNSTVPILIDKLYNQWIVILHCDTQKDFGVNKSSIPLIEFIDVFNCIQFITNHSEAELFLVIVGNTKPDALRKMYDFQQINAIYFLGVSEPDHSNNRRRVSGSFNSIEDLTKQLHQDISFFREQHIHTTRIDFFQDIDEKKQLISELDNKHKNFLLFNLFIEIVSQIPLLQIISEYIKKVSENLLNRSTGGGQQTTIQQEQLIKWESYPELSEIILTLHYLNRLNNLLTFHTALINIQPNTSEASLSRTVYVTKIISKNDFDSIRTNGIISIGIFLLATKSLLTACNIARQAASYGLMSVLFQIEVIYDTPLLDIDDNRVVFNLGPVFRVKSFIKAPDGVYYVKLKCADSDFRLIKKQLQFEIGAPLTWQTFGNYLYNIKLKKQAITYYEYLLKALPDNIHRASICNNIGLIYTMDKRKDKANDYYDQALKYAASYKSAPTSAEQQDDLCIQRPASKFTSSSDPIPYSTILGDIADVHYENNNRQKALEFYRKAFETSTDPRSLLYYQQMIINLSKAPY